VVLVLVLVSSRYNTKQRVHGTGRWMECDGSYPSSEWDGMSGVPMMMVVVMMGDGYLVHGDSFQEGLTKTIFR